MDLLRVTTVKYNYIEMECRCNIIKSLYKQPTFKVDIDGATSKWYTQVTGVRQGCPLSPYPLLIVMTVMLHDVHSDHN